MDIVFHRVESISITKIRSGTHQWIRILLTENDGREHDIDIFNTHEVPSLTLCGVEMLDREAA